MVEDLVLMTAILQGQKINFGNLLLSKVLFVYEKVILQKLQHARRVMNLSFGKVLSKILVFLGVLTDVAISIPSLKGSMDHASLLRAQYCIFQGKWVKTSTLDFA